MQGDMQVIVDALPFLIPIIIIELALMVIAVVDIAKRKYVTGGNKVVWILIVVLISLIGPIIYFIVGRKEKSDDTGDTD